MVSAGCQDRTNPEAVPVGQCLDPPLHPIKRQGGAGTAVAGHGDQREYVAFLDQTLPPFEPIKWRGSGRCAQQSSERSIALHFLKIIVINDGDQQPVPCLPEPKFNVRATVTTTILPLDHLALRGSDEAPALVLRGSTLSFKDLRSRVSRLAGWLAAQVPQQGARVASWVAKGELACLMPLAAARAGLVHVPVNPLLKRAQVTHILADSGAAMLIATPSRLNSLEAGDVPGGCMEIAEGDALDLAAALARDLAPSSGNPDELAAILYTS